MAAKDLASRFILCAFVAGSAGCGAAVKQAAKDAAPAAVEGSIKSAHKPETRERIADVLADPQIRQAAGELSQAVTDGVVNALTEEQRLARLRQASDAFVDHMSQSLAASMQRDFAPAFAKVVSTSLAQGIDQRAEERVEALARAIARGSAEGLSDAWEARLQKSGPAVSGVVQQMGRDLGRGAALGFQDAVATSTAKAQAGSGQQGNVLALTGATSDSLLALLHGIKSVLVLAFVAAALAVLAWLVRRYARHRTAAR